MKDDLRSAGVELSVTCWERTYRKVLRPGFFWGLQEMNCFQFTRRSVVVNNVIDNDDVLRRAEHLIVLGELNDIHIVSEQLPTALRRTGLRMRHIRPLEHYTDHFLVAMAARGCQYVVCWDSDAKLQKATDWISPGYEYLRTHSGVLAIQPGWPDKWSMDAERLEVDGDFDLGYGFTDHVFLVDRDILSKPIYRYFAPASWWYPTAHVAPIFEQRVDAYMRRKRLLRATYRPATYFHDEAMADQSVRSLSGRVNRKARITVTKRLDQLWPTFNPTFVRRPHLRE